MATLQDLLSQHIGAAFSRQLAFADFLEDRAEFNVNIRTGTVQFGNDAQFPIQLLGSEADKNESWLWAWANKASNLPDSLLVEVNRLREIGIAEQVEELTTPTYPLNVANGHMLSLLASGITGKCCYYRGPYDGGALFFLVLDPPALVLQPAQPERVITVLGEVISQFEVDHRAMAESFLRSQRFQLQKTDDELISIAPDGSTVNLGFDSEGRISKIGGKIEPRRSAPKKWWEFWKA